MDTSRCQCGPPGCCTHWYCPPGRSAPAARLIQLLFAATACVSPASPFSPHIQGEMEVVDGDSRIFTVQNFLSEAEADTLIQIGEDMLTRRHGESWRERHVYSNGFFGTEEYDETPLMAELEERIARLTMVKSHTDEPAFMFTRQIPGMAAGTDLENQALRNVHHDKNSRENRVVTVLIYLSSANAGDGGHTLLPCLPAQPRLNKTSLRPTQPKGAKKVSKAFAGRFRELFDRGVRIIKASDHSEPDTEELIQACNEQCAYADDAQVLSIQPKKGMALVVWHVQPDGQPNHLAWHAACQALDGGHRYALQKFKEFPRVSGEWKLDTQGLPVWRRYGDETAAEKRQRRDASRAQLSAGQEVGAKADQLAASNGEF